MSKRNYSAAMGSDEVMEDIDRWLDDFKSFGSRFHILFEFMYFLCLRTMGTIETFNLLMIVLNFIYEWKRYREKMYQAKVQVI